MLRRRLRLGGVTVLASLTILAAAGLGRAQVYGTLSGGGVVTTPRGTIFSSTGAGATPRGTIFRTGEAVTSPRGTIFRSQTFYSPATYQAAPTYVYSPANQTESFGYPPSSTPPSSYAASDISGYGGIPTAAGATPAGTIGPAAFGAALPVAGGTAALIDVRLPSVGEVRFEGMRMHQPGTLGRFVTPALEPGQTYSYNVRASWFDGNRVVTRQQRVLVRPGDRLTVDFLTTPSGLPATSTVRTGLVPE